jgi:SAM-dependent methyltransferase
MLKENHAENWGFSRLLASRRARRAHQARLASRREQWISRNQYFYDGLARLLRFIVEPGKRVLNVRCQTGYLLHCVQPSYGVGVDISQEIVAIAHQKYPSGMFLCSDPETLTLKEKFDYIVFTDVSDTVDVLATLKQVALLCESHTRLIIYNYNNLWETILKFGSHIGLRMPMIEPNWLSESDLVGMLSVSGFEHLRTYRRFLIPKEIPLVSWFANQVLARLPGLARLCMTQVLVARPSPVPRDPKQISVSIIIPCKNERDNVELAVRRIPEMGKHTEIIFCDDKSTDGTAEQVRRMQRKFPDKDIRLLDGAGIGKAENVWTGFRSATGDVLMILDGDLAVMPEELPYFFDAIVMSRGEFVNGCRLVYAMQRNSMKATNFVGNRVFAALFSLLLGQKIKDTLCGTKVLWRRDWKRIERTLGSWGVTDRWGDYELLFGAAKLQLRIVELPVHYQERIYGTTKMTHVIRNGLCMLRMWLAALAKLKMEY